MKFAVLLVILVFTGISVFFRWLAFNRVDSVAFDLSVSSMAYTLLKPVLSSNSWSEFINAICDRDWLLCCFFSVAIVVVLAIIHHYFFGKLFMQIENKIAETKRKLTGNNSNRTLKSDALDATIPLARHAVFLSYITFIKRFSLRKGKRIAREKFAGLLTRISGNNELSERDFCLNKKNEIVGLVAFNLLGGIALCIPVFFS